MDIWSVLAYFGIPTLLVGSMFGYLLKRMRKYKEESDAIKRGLQALLRSSMIDDYNKYLDKGYAPIYAKENFKNVYENYHSLGANGVMDNIYKEFLEMPTEHEHRKEKED